MPAQQDQRRGVLSIRSCFNSPASQPEIQIVDTPKKLETTVSASFAAGHHQINRTLVIFLQ